MHNATGSSWWSTTATAMCAAALWIGPQPARAAGRPGPSPSPQTPAAQQQPAASAADAAEGEALFLGRKPLENGGPPCKTCHGISNLSISHGPTPGPNLTNEYSNFGPEAIDKYLQQPPVRPMSILFKQSPIMPDERRELIAFLRHEDEANPYFMPPPPPAPETIAAGKALFTGRVRLQNGGPACVTCHTVAGIPFPHGGTMGPDLTREYANLGPLGVSVALRTLDFPAMNPLYEKHSLTATEQRQFAAFFENLYRRRLPASPTRAMALAALAVFAALFLWTLLAGRRHRSRLARQRSLTEAEPRKGNRG